MQEPIMRRRHSLQTWIALLYKRLCASLTSLTSLTKGVHSTRSVGAIAEQQAADYLMQQGLTVIARNLRRRVGEIDLYCQEGSVSVFVEVRYRGIGAWQDAGRSINEVKRQKILRVSRQLMREQSLLQIRIDTVLIDEGKPIRWVRDAIRF